VNELRDLAAKGVITLNHNGEPDDFSSQWRLLSPATKSVPVQSYVQYLQVFDRILFQNEGQRRDFEALRYPSVGQTAVIWPSCNESAARRAAAEPDPYDSSLVNLVCVAKFQRGKKQLDLIKAYGEVLPKYPSTHLTMVGGSIKDKSYLMECQEYVAEKKLTDHVEFVGYREDALRYIAHSDVFVLVSEGEGTSRAVREAVFLGKPIVSRRLAGVESFLGAEGAFWVVGKDVRSVLEEVLQGSDKRTRVAESAHGRYAELATETKFFAAIRSYFGLEELSEP
jgi:glycosyltransferase involved in cell wall biosynthesis